MAQDYVLELLSKGKISSGKAAELLDKTVYEIQDKLREKGISSGASVEQYEKARKTKLPQRRK